MGVGVVVQLVPNAGGGIPETTTSDLARVGIVAGSSGPAIVFFDRLEPEMLWAGEGGLAVAVTADERTLRVATVPLLKAGFLDVLWSGAPTWTVRLRALLDRRRAIDALIQAPLVTGNIEGRSERWRETLRRTVELSQCDASVLLTGPTGTGKELLARLIHGLDPRPDKGDLVVLDCTTLVAELSGSELFGHERGAFTGALTAREGIIAQAERGTLFLDEVGELPLVLQAQLLRVLQEHTYRRVGADSFRSASFRLVAATHRDLVADVQAGRFRADLYFRIAASTVRLPALDERRSDIVPLAQFFLRQVSKEQVADFDPMFKAHLLCRAYPGNVRELKHLVARAYHRWVGPGPLSFSALPEEEWGAPALDLGAEMEPAIRKALATNMGLKEISRISRELAVRLAVKAAEGNLQKAAALLGVTDRALQIRRARKLEL